MKKLFLVLFLTIFAAAVSINAQTPVPVKFNRGAISATITGKLAGPAGMQIYSVRVKRGQNLRVEQVGGGNRKVSLSIKNGAGEDVSDMEASCNNNKYIALTDDGTYLITVTMCGKVDPWKGAYKLRVTAEKPVAEPK